VLNVIMHGLVVGDYVKRERGEKSIRRKSSSISPHANWANQTEKPGRTCRSVSPPLPFAAVDR
jgi:hypothetical protein